MKTIFIKLKFVSSDIESFTLQDGFGNVILENIPVGILLEGKAFSVDDDINFVKLVSENDCVFEKTFKIGSFSNVEANNLKPIITKTSCVWRHIKNPTIFNTFYGKIEPYIIEYPFAYEFFDQIVQSVSEHSKVYQYLKDEFRIFNTASKIKLEDAWFNKAVLYNDQQSSGILNLDPKPVNNLKAYSQYPIFLEDSKTILYTKSDNFYQYNNFWSIVKDPKQPLFKKTCTSLSLDKVVNQENMDYSLRSFKKATLRGKDLKIRHILDNRDDINIVSQFITNITQISYK
jgi:hypothetical protein